MIEFFNFNNIALSVGSGVVGGAEGPLLPHEVGGGVQ